VAQNIRMICPNNTGLMVAICSRGVIPIIFITRARVAIPNFTHRTNGGTHNVYSFVEFDLVDKQK